MRTRYYIYAEANGRHELERVFESDDLKKAKEKLRKITDKYARIEKHTEEYRPAPAGKVYRDENYGWETEKTEVIEEN